MTARKDPTMPPPKTTQAHQEATNFDDRRCPTCGVIYEEHTADCPRHDYRPARGPHVEATRPAIDHAARLREIADYLDDPTARALVLRTASEAADAIDHLREEARRFYLADGSFKLLDTPEEVTASRIAAAKRIAAGPPRRPCPDDAERGRVQLSEIDDDAE